jgi:CRP-like cAMP-binding protein
MKQLNGPHPASANKLLSALPREEYARLQKHMETVHLTKGRILYHIGDPMTHVYFPLSGMVSFLSIEENGSAVEIAMVANEGMVGVPVILKSYHSPYQVMMQIPGDASRVRADVLGNEFDRGGRLQHLLLRYTYMLLTQITQSAACNRFHSAEQRLCRWLLISRERVQSDTLHLTQEFLAHMLGSPRTKVTEIAANLQRANLISYSRGTIRILNPGGLERASCECYRIVSEGFSYFLAA